LPDAGSAGPGAGGVDGSFAQRLSEAIDLGLGGISIAGDLSHPSEGLSLLLFR